MKYYLEGIIQRGDVQNTGRIYPSDLIEIELQKLAKLKKDFNDAKNRYDMNKSVMEIGGQLYVRFGASDEDVIRDCNTHLSSDDLYIKKQALIFIIIRIRDRIEKNHL